MFKETAVTEEPFQPKPLSTFFNYKNMDISFILDQTNI